MPTLSPLFELYQRHIYRMQKYKPQIDVNYKVNMLLENSFVGCIYIYIYFYFIYLFIHYYRQNVQLKTDIIRMTRSYIATLRGGH